MYINIGQGKAKCFVRSNLLMFDFPIHNSGTYLNFLFAVSTGKGRFFNMCIPRAGKLRPIENYFRKLVHFNTVQQPERQKEKDEKVFG